MNVVLNILLGLGSFIFGYLFGSFSFSVFIGKVFFHKDPREFGSKNPGSTNTGRLFGMKIGALVMFLDFLKGLIPCLIVWSIFRFSGIDSIPETIDGFKLFDHGILYYNLTYVGAILGHCYSCFLHFKGGKGVASMVGYFGLTCWLLLILGFLVFGITLKIKKYVSLASIVVSVFSVIAIWIFVVGIQTNPLGAGQSAYNPAAPLGSWAFGVNLFRPCFGYAMDFGSGFEIAGCQTFVAGLVIWRHKGNIKRLKKGEERKISWMK